MGRQKKLGLIGAVLALAALVPVALADGPAAGVVTPGWTTGASMAEKRAAATTTLLPNGKLLVAGGQDGRGQHDSSELYDPVTDTWTGSGSMSFYRNGHFAVLLKTGKVLIGGGVGSPIGEGSSDPLASAELYDPATGTFAPTGSMLFPREQTSAVLLADGRVFVAGGNGTTTEIYSPGTGTWSAGAPMSVAKTRVGAVLLSSGKVLLAGGDNGGSPQAGVQLYDPVSNTFATGAAAAPAMSGSRDRPTLTLLTSGKALAAGGTGTGAGTAETYDPTANAWSPAGTLGSSHPAGAAASLLRDGRVMISGGDSSFGTVSTELYNPTTNTWSSAGGTQGLLRSFHTSTTLPNGQVVLTGSLGDSGLPASIFTPQTSLSSQSLSFGNQDVGTTRAAAPITVTNTGQTPLLVRGVTLGGTDRADFTLATNTCSPAPVAPNATCTLAFTFTPGAAGARNATVSFRANTDTGTHTGNLSGVGTAAVVAQPTASPAPAPTAQPTATPPDTRKPQLFATLSFTFTAAKKSTKLSSLTVKPTEKGATVTFKCAKGCAKKAFTKTNAGSSVALTSLVKGKALKVNATIVVTVAKAGFLGTTKTLKIRAGKAPSVTTKLGV